MPAWQIKEMLAEGPGWGKRRVILVAMEKDALYMVGVVPKPNAGYLKCLCAIALPSLAALPMYLTRICKRSAESAPPSFDGFFSAWT